jgi:DNA-binding NtrC family response regulator
VLQSYDWPGNVRELKHCVERMAAMQSEGACRWPISLRRCRITWRPPRWNRLSKAVESTPAESFTLPPKSPVISLPQSEALAIRNALEATAGERAKAARLLKIGRTTLYRKMKEYNLA